MNLAPGPVLLAAVSLLPGGLMSLTMPGLLLMNFGPRPPAAGSGHAAWREEPTIDPIRDGTAVAAPER
jgi:hypothetical protein